MGPLLAVRGSHDGPLHSMYDERRNWVLRIPEETVAAYGADRVVSLTGPAGSMILLNCRTIHGSRRNESARPRPLLLNVYTAADAFPYTANPIPSALAGSIVRGVPARWAHTRPATMRTAARLVEGVCGTVAVSASGPRGGRVSGAWRRYYDRTATRPPRRTLAFALDRFDAAPPPVRRAVDLGCGTGRDTVAMLAREWRVLAIDAEPAALAGLRSRGDLPPDAALETRVARFEEARWGRCALLNSSFALPLVPPPQFAALWPRLMRSLVSGGRLACQLFGTRDGWAGSETITFHSRAEVDALLAPLHIEHFREEETDSITPRGTPKHWHLFHIVARNP